MASVVSEMGDSEVFEVFDESPHWDDEEMFDGRSLLEVIWDREVSDGLFDERSAPAVIWDEDILSEHAAYNVFEEMPLKDNVTALLEQAMFSTPIASKDGSKMVFAEVLLENEVASGQQHLVFSAGSSQGNNTANPKETNPFSILSIASDGVLDNWADSDAENASVTENSRSDTDEKESGEPVSDWEDLDDKVLQNQFSPSNRDEVSQKSSYKTVCQGMGLAEWSHAVTDTVNGHNFEEDVLVNLHIEHTGYVNVHNNPDGVELQSERQAVMKKLKELFFIRQQATVSSQDPVDSYADQCVPEEKPVNTKFSFDPFGATMGDKISSEEHHGDYAELRHIISDLAKRADALAKKQNLSDQDILFLREVVKDSGRKVQQLEYLVDELQFKLDSSLSHLGSMCNLTKPSIFLIGVYNSVTWLSSLDSFSPEKDILVGLTKMSSPRSYATATALDGPISAIGSYAVGTALDGPTSAIDVLENGIFSVNQANLYTSYKSLLIIGRPLLMILHSVRMSWDPGISTATA